MFTGPGRKKTKIFRSTISTQSKRFFSWSPRQGVKFFRPLAFLNLQVNQNSNYDRPVKYIAQHQGVKTKTLSEMNDLDFLLSYKKKQ